MRARALLPTACATALALGLGVLAACGSTSGSGSGAGSRSGAGSGSPAKLSVSGSYVPQPATADMAAGYLVVRNSGGTADRLVSASSPDAKNVSLDQTTANSMTEVSSMTVPAGGELVLARGGKHLMLMDLGKRPAVGSTVELRLTFAHSGTLVVRAPVEPLTWQPGDPR